MSAERPCIIVGGDGFLGRSLTRQLIAAHQRVIIIDEAVDERVNQSVTQNVNQNSAASVDGSVDARVDATSNDSATSRDNIAAADIERFCIDIRDRDALLRNAPKLPRGAAVVNLAARQYHRAIVRRHRHRWFAEVNVQGAMNVCALARAIDAAGIVQFSTDMVYGAPQTAPVDEAHPRNPIGEYGQSKVQMENQLRDWCDANDINATIFRPRLIAGGGRLGVFVSLFKLIRRNWPVPLIGAGRNVYQMVSVDDCARAIVAAIDRNFPRATYNLGSNPTLCVRDLMKQLIIEVGSNSKVLPTPARLVHAALRSLAVIGITPLHPEQYLLADKNFIVNIDKSRRELNWSPRSDDLQLMVEAYQHWRHRRDDGCDEVKRQSMR